MRRGYKALMISTATRYEPTSNGGDLFPLVDDPFAEDDLSECPSHDDAAPIVMSSTPGSGVTIASGGHPGISINIPACGLDSLRDNVATAEKYIAGAVNGRVQLGGPMGPTISIAKAIETLEEHRNKLRYRLVSDAGNVILTTSMQNYVERNQMMPSDVQERKKSITVMIRRATLSARPTSARPTSGQCEALANGGHFTTMNDLPPKLRTLVTRDSIEAAATTLNDHVTPHLNASERIFTSIICRNDSGSFCPAQMVRMSMTGDRTFNGIEVATGGRQTPRAWWLYLIPEAPPLPSRFSLRRDNDVSFASSIYTAMIDFCDCQHKLHAGAYLLRIQDCMRLAYCVRHGIWHECDPDLTLILASRDSGVRAAVADMMGCRGLLNMPAPMDLPDETSGDIEPAEIILIETAHDVLGVTGQIQTIHDIHEIVLSESNTCDLSDEVRRAVGNAAMRIKCNRIRQKQQEDDNKNTQTQAASLLAAEELDAGCSYLQAALGASIQDMERDHMATNRTPVANFSDLANAWSRIIFGGEIMKYEIQKHCDTINHLNILTTAAGFVITKPKATGRPKISHRCQYITRAGVQCSRQAVTSSDRCCRHSTKQTAETTPDQS